MKYSTIIWRIMKHVEEDDPNFEFLSGLLSYALKHDGLTDAQARYADKFYKKYHFLFEKDERVKHAVN